MRLWCQFTAVYMYFCKWPVVEDKMPADVQKRYQCNWTTRSRAWEVHLYRHMTTLGRVLIPQFSLLHTDYYLDLLTFCWQSCTRLKWLINLKYGFWKIFILLLLWHTPAQGFRSTAVGSNSFPPVKTSHCLLHSLISSNTFGLWKSALIRRLLLLLTEHVSESQFRHRQEKC